VPARIVASERRAIAILPVEVEPITYGDPAEADPDQDMGFHQRCHRAMPPRKTKLATTKAAKGNANASPSRDFATLALSEPWMPKWAESALTTGSAEEACVAVLVSLADFADARHRDPVFDDLCRMLDQLADLRITEKLRAEAICGNIRAQTLYYARVRDLVLPDDASQPAETMISAAIAEAMISAGLLAASIAPAAPGASPPALPQAWQSKTRRTREPDE
jgi:hypothetical protein